MKFNLAVICLLVSINVSAQKSDVTIETLWTLNDNPNTSKEYLFLSPDKAECDSKGNLYVIDRNGFEIKKFSKDGKYILTIGRTGSGPGEFKSIDVFFIDAKDKIHIYDVVNERFTIFDASGKLISSKKMKKQTQLRKILNAWDGTKLGVKFLDRNGGKKRIGNKFIVFGEDPEIELTSFGYSTIYLPEDDIIYNMVEIFNLLNIAVSPKGVFLTNEYYDGNIYYFEKNKNWQHSILKGKQPKYKPYIYEASDKSDDNLKRGSVNWKDDMSGKYVAMIPQNFSRGLFSYQNKYILNFLFLKEDNGEYEYGIDVFNFEGKYLGYKLIKKGKRNEDKMDMYISEVLCKDADDNYYIKKMNNNYVDVIQKIKININL